jgi:hypothetical protein
MDENQKLIQEFVDKNKDTLVIDMFEIKVLRGWYEDNDPETMDYYWILQDIKGEFVQSSCVGEIIALKGVIPDESYDRLRSMFQYNLDRLNEKIL